MEKQPTTAASLTALSKEERQEYLQREKERWEARQLSGAAAEVPVTAPNAFGFLSKERVDKLEEQVQLYKRAKTALLRITDEGDWLDMAGTAYLTESGVHKVASIAGVDFGAPGIFPTTGEDSRGKWAAFKAELTASWSWNGRRIAEIGTASSRDAFFGRANNEDIPFENIDLQSVEKKSVTNAQGRALKRLLGLGGISWETLGELGISKKKGVRYKGHERPGVGVWTPEKQLLWSQLLDITDGDEDLAISKLLKATTNEGKGIKGTRDPKRLSTAQVRYIAPGIAAEHAATFEDPADEPRQREPGEEG